MSHSQDQVTDAVLAFISAESWEEGKRIVEERRDVLLTGAVEEVFADLLVQYQGDENSTRALEEHRALLAHCRREGIGSAFASYLQPSAATPENKLESLLQELNLRSLMQELSRLSAPGEMPRRIAVCRAALVLIDRYEQPQLWAGLQVELGNGLRQNPQENRADNLEDAISHYEQALEIYTREDFPVQWAQTYNNLAIAYWSRIWEDRAENFERAIFYWEQNLKVYTRQDFPAEWATTQHTLAAAYHNRIREDRAENLERSISRYKLALEVFTREGFPPQWAITQANLANAYSVRIKGVSANNLEESISRFKQALEVHTREGFPEEWAEIQNSLANAYSNRIREDRADNMEEAIRRYQLALEVRSRRNFPAEWARIQNNLSNAYRERIREDRAENLERSIFHCEQVLEVYSRQGSPELWALTLRNLANAYRERIREDRAENLERSISCYDEALEVYTREDFPAEWAGIQNNLAAVYQERIREDRAENLERSIFHCEQALEVFTRQDSAMNWALILNNLANAYRGRIREDRAENLERSISRYKLALEVFTREGFPPQWAITQANLAGAYVDRIREDRAGNIEEAIHRYQLALEVHSRRDFPVQWALTQTNLAIAYWNRIREDKSRNIEEAVSRFKLALEVYTREDFPLDWARVQNILAAVYQVRIREDRSHNIAEAVSRFKLALEIRTPDTLPQDCRDTALNLGLLLYSTGRFAEARVALTTAHKAVEALRGEIRREGAKQKLAKENANLYAQLVHCCLIEGDEEAAFEYAVAGKGRAFVDLLATASFDLSVAGADDPQLGADLREARELRQQIDNLLARLGGESETSPDEDGEELRSVWSQTRADLRSLQEQEAAHWEEMSYRYPALMATQQAPTLSVEEAQELAKELGATLVEYYRHAGGWCAFVVGPDEINHVPLPGVDEVAEYMLGWVAEVESPYYGRNEQSYESLRDLHEAVIAPLGDHLPRGGAVVLAPFSWLHLVPLVAALDPQTERYAAEEHQLGFTPNLAALRVALDQQASHEASSVENAYRRLLSVAYPGVPGSEHYLSNVEPEAEAVARYFREVTMLHQDPTQGTEPTPDAVLSHARGQDVVHFGCHGTFEPGAPEQSGLMLSGGWLTVQRIITELNLEETKLATIGACLSGRVHVGQAEEHVGLVQAMMSAGARAVVASLWSVDDTSTRALFEAFYAAIKIGKSPAVALSEAARRVRERPGWEHPYYWAAFQPTGLAQEGGGSDPTRLPDEVASRVEAARRERRGSVRRDSKMDKSQVVQDSIFLLRQMKRRPGKLRVMLEEAGERQGVAVRLRDLEERAARVQTETQLLELADAVLRLVEETSALERWLLPGEMDVDAARQQRWFSIKNAEASPEDLYVQENTAQILNHVREIRWEAVEPQEENH